MQAAAVPLAPGQVTITTPGPNGTVQTITAPGSPVAEPSAIALVSPPDPPLRSKQIIPLIGGIFLLLPISVAIAQRIAMRGRNRPPAALSSATEERLARLEQGVDAIAIEMERVSEGQRYLTKLLSAEKVAR